MTTVNERLDAFMNQFDKKQNAATAAKDATKAREDAFREQCNLFFDQTVQLQIDAFKSKLEGGGHTLRPLRKREGDPTIGFQFLPRGSNYNGTTTPEFRLTSIPYSGKIGVYIAKLSGYGSTAGGSGEFTIAQLTIDLLREKMFEVIESAAG